MFFVATIYVTRRKEKAAEPYAGRSFLNTNKIKGKMKNGMSPECNTITLDNITVPRVPLLNESVNTRQPRTFTGPYIVPTRHSRKQF